jgi:hypothetical protein
MRPASMIITHSESVGTAVGGEGGATTLTRELEAVALFQRLF